MTSCLQNIERLNHSSNWYQSLLGEKTLANLDELLANSMSEIFGYYAIEMGVLGKHNFLEFSRIATGFSLSQTSHSASIIATSEQLPIDTDNVDLVIASHVLETSNDPHQVLREIDRILVPEGECILIGFNPFTPSRYILQLGTKIRSGFKKEKNSHKIWSSHRVRDWFSLLGFEVLDLQYMGFRPNINNKKLFESFSWLDYLGEYAGPMLGDVYLLHVKKQVVAMHPHKKVWLAPAVLSGGKVALNNTAQNIRRKNYLNY